ncbi:MAG: histidine--tRNA ligase [Asgard group archaeon]|nr:histidine--tRNA ligase [Asgard group archaeon]
MFQLTNEETKKIKISRSAGFRDFFPEDFAKVDFVLETMRRVSKEFGYEEYTTPAVELQKLYELKSGDELVGETFKIQSRSGQKLVLIPEITPSLSRMLAERQQYYSKPIRWFVLPRCYRDESLQRGRVKEFWQYNIDILGMDEIYADAEIITILVKIIVELGLSKEQFVVRVNDRSFMQQFFEAIGVKDFLSVIRVFDRKNKLLQEAIQKQLKGSFPDEEVVDIALVIRQVKTIDDTIFEKIPDTKITREIIETLDDIRRTVFVKALTALKVTSKQAKILYELSELETSPSKFIKKVKKIYPKDNAEELLANLTELAQLLDAFNVTEYVQYDGSLARGLDYYTGIVFEAWSRKGVLPRAIAGGGRYGDLVSELGGQPLTGTGLGFGETVVMELMDEYEITYPKKTACDVYIAPIKLEDLSVVIDLANKLQAKGLKTILNAFNWRIKRHFENAERNGVEWMLIVGKKDFENDAVTMKNIITGEQEVIPLKKIVNVLVKKFKK